ncbi:hypothetical protein HDK64DRAFT_70540 [Phyllosticta capitalensis]
MALGPSLVRPALPCPAAPSAPQVVVLQSMDGNRHRCECAAATSSGTPGWQARRYHSRDMGFFPLFSLSFLLLHVVSLIFHPCPHCFFLGPRQMGPGPSAAAPVACGPVPMSPVSKKDKNIKSGMTDEVVGGPCLSPRYSIDGCSVASPANNPTPTDGLDSLPPGPRPFPMPTSHDPELNPKSPRPGPLPRHQLQRRGWLVYP